MTGWELQTAERVDALGVASTWLLGSHHRAGWALNIAAQIRDLCVAEAVSTLTQTRQAYAAIVKRTSNGGPGDPLEMSAALQDLRARVHARYARLRTRTAARLV